MPFGLRGFFSEGYQDVPVMPETPAMPETTAMPETPVREVPQMSVTTTKAPKKNVRVPENQATMNATPPVNIPPAMPSPMMPSPMMPVESPPTTPEEFQNASPSMNQAMQHKNAVKEGFRTNYAEVSGGAKDQYQPIGAFDGVALPTGNNVSSWRYTSPDEPLLGAPFELGNDSLFMFKNNQCKPSCCGSSLSCSGGCVCTTPDQRQFIAARGGNRTKPAED